jgi:HKD family nuclease
MGKAPRVLASLLKNGEDEGHADEILRHLATATHFICIVAFAKFSGWKKIQKALAERAVEGLKATFVIGLNFYQSDPSVLRGIRSLQAKAAAAGGKIDLYIGDARSRETLHPKVYWSKGAGGQTLIVGSANMTWGGLAGNHELSVLLTGSAAKQQAWLKAWIDARLENEQIVEATPGLIADYEKRRDIYQATMKTAEQRASRAMEASAGDTLTLADLLIEMRADKGPEGFDQSIVRRRSSLPKAKAQLAVLARQPDLAQPAFLEAYEDLIRHWHSSGIIRGKTTVAKKPVEFQAALRALAAEPSNDPAVLFDLLMTYFERIPRAGTNVLTEILHTRDPARFPVMNRNSVAGMGLAHIMNYPRAPDKRSVNGARYARFIADAESLRKKLGLGDLSELDALFNYAYHRPEDGDEDENDED